MDTVESMHSGVHQKYKLVKRKADELRTLSAEVLAEPAIAGKQPAWAREKIRQNVFEDIGASADMIFAQYSSGVTSILIEYYRHTGGNIQWMNEITTRYNRVISIGDYTARLDRLADELKSLAADISSAATYIVAGVRDRVVLRVESHSRELCGLPPLQIHAERDETRACDCGETMISTGDSSLFTCKHCGKIRHAMGQMTAIPSADSQRISLAKDEHIRHYRTWVKRLQADDRILPPPKCDLDRIIEYINNPRIVPDINLLYCPTMRSILRDLRLTKHNNIVATVIVAVGGPRPYRLTSAEENRSEVMFKYAMALYDTVIPDGKNKPYYPFFIFKIWQIMFEGDEKKLKNLRFFHLQQWDTVMKNDAIWKKICAKSQPEDGLVYMSTPSYII